MRQLLHRLKLFYEYILYSNKVYRFFLKPFDRIHYPIVNRDQLREERSQGRVPFNKIPQVADLANPEWQAVLADWGSSLSMTAEIFHRKVWEFNQIIYILKKLGYLYPKNRCLAIGAGKEEILYYLANKIERITAIDLYEGLYFGSEDSPDIIRYPDKYAPFLYNLSARTRVSIANINRFINAKKRALP